MNKICVAIILLFSLCANAQPRQPISFVNPLIGTAKMGHTYPGATVPFGSVQLSPDTDTLSYVHNGKYNPDIYKYCAGYQYNDPQIVGFSHTHFSGTGHSDLGDFLIMPTTGKLQLNPGTKNHPENGYRSAYSHDKETAAPNYYKVLLEEPNVTAELTTTQRVGLHRYTFPKTDQAHLIFDLMSGIYNFEEKNVWTYVRVVNDTLITGYRQTMGWARTRTVYFAMAFSKPFKNYGAKEYNKSVTYKGFWGKFDQTKNFPEIAGKQIRMYFDFETKENEQIQVKFAISPVSQTNSIENLEKETPGWNFDRIKEKGQAEWNRELSRIKATFEKPDDQVSFYTAMYHAFLSPTLYMDSNGEYKGIDQNIHRAQNFNHYTTFSLWDTYRALHPFFNLIQPVRNQDIIQSMLAHFEQSPEKMLPIWSHYANENWCMIGYHSVSVIADAIAKGNTHFDLNKALDACVTTARFERFEGIGDYMKLGYVPEDRSGSSVSKTLEYAYDDWCIAQIAKKLNRAISTKNS